jgi:hypothetical protein
LDNSVGFSAKKGEAITLGVLRFPRPPVPVSGSAVHHAGFRLGLQDCDLILELVRQPDIIVIQKRDVLAFRFADAQVARRAHAEILVARMIDVSDSIGIFPDVTASNLGASIG